MKKNILLTSVLLSSFFNAQNYYQELSSNVLSNTSSPNVASFIKYKEANVNYYNGKGDISIPIYKISIGNLQYPISLNYGIGGIQVNSFSSDVGLGWSLTDTFINRTIVGDADWETLPNVNRPTGMSCTVPDPLFSHMKTGFVNRSGATNWTNVKMDYYPDLFKMFSPISNSVFYFPEKTTVVDLNKAGTKINWQMNTKKYNYLTNNNQNVNDNVCVTDFDNFELTTKDGITYFFSDKDITHSFQQNLQNVYDDLGSIAGTFPRVSSWHVSKIKDNVTNEEINFIYDEYSSETTNDISTILTQNPFIRYEQKLPRAYPNNVSCFLPSDNAISDDAGKFFNRQLITKRLKKIIFRNGSVEFNYNFNRLDIKNAKALTNVTVKDINGKTIKEVNFEYDYFNSSIQINEYSKRLKLLSIQESGKNKNIFEYYEDNKLPNIGSIYQDFFGYNNQIEVPYNSNNFGGTAKKYSKYYYYPQKKELSILPYNITSDNNHYLLNGLISKEPNELSKTWSLKKITFPSGGSNYFELESNEFSLWGENLKGGGVRIKRQEIKEDNTNVTPRIISYTYKKDGGLSSGYLLNNPYVGHPASNFFDVLNPNPDLSGLANLEDYFFLYTNSKLNYDILSNFFIGYSRVEENENGKKSIYEYTNDEYANDQTRTYWTQQGVTSFSNHCLSSFLYLNSALGNDIFIDKSHLRGKLKTLTIFDQNNSLLLKKENIYKSLLETGSNDLDLNERYISGAMVLQKLNTSGDNNASFAELIESKKSYSRIFNNLSKSKTTTYSSNNNIVKEEEYWYDNVQNNTVIFNKLDDTGTYPYYSTAEMYYPYHPYVSNEPFVQDLININKINMPIVTKSYKGELDLINHDQTQTFLINSTKISFKKDSSSNNFIMPKTIQTSIGDNPYVDGTTNDLFDDKGNILQYTPKDGTPVTIIWGYNQTKPIAKIEGISYSQLANIFGFQNTNTGYKALQIVINSDLDTNDSFENQTFIPSLNSFKQNSQLQNYKVTTYVYDPLVGIKTIIPPSGIKEYYIYDSVGRLKEIRENDINGNILKEYDYNYKH
ncbi:hypothetical protein [Chryseobacterium gambrini]|uniref:DUF5977 domain-containing protein n=1 Tax=Chryseobacterium gambrini TaxID=373672 RepID=A0ABN7CGF1_9FLAO|nr:DUF5977 domain-containing protein [Chryseobacterium gambrini]